MNAFVEEYHDDSGLFLSHVKPTPTEELFGSNGERTIDRTSRSAGLLSGPPPPRLRGAWTSFLLVLIPRCHPSIGTEGNTRNGYGE